MEKTFEFNQCNHVQIIFNNCCDCKPSKFDFDDSGSTERLDYEAFVPYGNLHNHFLSYINDYFETPSYPINSLDEGVEHLNIFLSKATEALPAEQAKLLSNSITVDATRVEFLNTNAFVETYFGEQGLIYDQIAELYKKGRLDDFEKDSLLGMAKVTHDCYKEMMSIEELIEYLLNGKDEWWKQNYSKKGSTGSVVPAITAIALSSAEWWQKHPEAAGADVRAASPVQPAADLAGAVVGAVANIGKTLLYDQTSIKGGKLAEAAAIGAVAASVGAVAKVTKFIVDLFKWGK